MAVSVYSTPTCTFCTKVKEYLQQRQIKFVDYDVSRDQRKGEEMVHKSRQTGVPVIDFNGQIVVGFDKNRLDRLIAQTKK
ncbi:MAG TPA: glutaredoxin domain-containing protein [Spirochaetia bacterium]|nr:glutaredoxin domain-containing protein [Spirochaetia bacterium]